MSISRQRVLALCPSSYELENLVQLPDHLRWPQNPWKILFEETEDPPKPIGGKDATLLAGDKKDYDNRDQGQAVADKLSHCGTSGPLSIAHGPRLESQFKLI